MKNKPFLFTSGSIDTTNIMFLEEDIDISRIELKKLVNFLPYPIIITENAGGEYSCSFFNKNFIKKIGYRTSEVPAVIDLLKLMVFIGFGTGLSYIIGFSTWLRIDEINHPKYKTNFPLSQLPKSVVVAVIHCYLSAREYFNSLPLNNSISISN